MIGRLDTVPFRRFYSLDALRGIAALTVAFWHCYLMLPVEMIPDDLGWFYRTPLRLFVNGEAAVVIFFVLSGFVLTLSYLNAPPTYWQFLVRRFFRIYVPFAFAIVFVGGLYSLLFPNAPAELGAWVQGGYLPQMPIIDLVGLSLLMVGTTHGNLLDPPIWTLVHEMRISLVFPLLLVLGCDARGAMKWAVILFLISLIAGLFGKFILFPAITEDFTTTFLATLHFIPCFLMGIALARAGGDACERFARLATTKRIACWLFCFICYCAFNDITNRGGVFVPYGIREAFYIAAATLLIALILTSPYAEEVLLNRILQWLGKISFGLFLVHMPVLFVIRHILGQVPLWIVFAVGISVSILVATVMNRLIEVPAMRYSHSLFLRNHRSR